MQIDHLKHSLMKAEDDCKLERKHSMKLKQAIEQRPSHEVVWEIQQEKELLLAKNQELENTLQVGESGCKWTPEKQLPAAARAAMRLHLRLVWVVLAVSSHVK